MIFFMLSWRCLLKAQPLLSWFCRLTPGCHAGLYLAVMVVMVLLVVMLVYTLLSWISWFCWFSNAGFILCCHGCHGSAGCHVGLYFAVMVGLGAR